MSHFEWEAKAIFELFKTLVLKGKVIVGDAMFCQRDICQEIVDSDGDYFFVVKENQPTLLKNIQLAFTETITEVAYAVTSIGRDQADAKHCLTGTVVIGESRIACPGCVMKHSAKTAAECEAGMLRKFLLVSEIW